MDKSRIFRAGVIFIALMAVAYGTGLTPFGITFAPKAPLNMGDTWTLKDQFTGKALGAGPFDYPGGWKISYVPDSFLQCNPQVHAIDTVKFADASESVFIFTFACAGSNPSVAYAIPMTGSPQTTYMTLPIKAKGTYTTADESGWQQGLVPFGNGVMISGTLTNPSGVSTSFTVRSGDNPVQNAWSIIASGTPGGPVTIGNTYYVAYISKVNGTSNADAFQGSDAELQAKFLPVIDIETGSPGGNGGKIIDLNTWWSRFGINDKNTQFGILAIILLGVSYMGAKYVKW